MDAKVVCAMERTQRRFSMTTIVFPPGRFICYLRQPKAATLSMTHWLVDLAKQNNKPYLTSLPYQQKNYNVDVEQDTIITHHMTAARVKEVFPQWWNKMEKMVTVRNPWNLLASKYYHMRKLGVTQARTDTFENFCLGLIDLRGTLNPGKEYYSINNEIIAEHIIPIEDLETHLTRIFKGYTLPPIPFVNVGSNGNYKKLFNSDINKLIHRDFAWEIETFNYKF